MEKLLKYGTDTTYSIQENIDKFLKAIDESPVKTQYVKIQVLDWNEAAVGTIEGIVTGGSINLSGTSNVRRNGSISLVLDKKVGSYYDIDNIESLISLNKKVKILIGFDIRSIDQSAVFSNDKRKDKIWFPLGVFVIKNPSISNGLNGLTISLTLSDKMSLLNGEVGGNFPAPVVFSETDIVTSDGTRTKEYALVEDIIRTVVSHYGGIPEDKIKISDVGSTTKKILKWGLEQPLYKYTQGNSKFLDVALPAGVTATATYESGDDIGYEIVPFTWPGAPLTANAGETITSVLDKLKTLGDYEYFFDIEGKFIWQAKKTYTYGDNGAAIDNAGFFNDGTTKEAFIIKPNSEGVPTYDFGGDDVNPLSPLVISISNTSQYNNFKNDYIIWGKRKTPSGAEVPIRYHIVFDNPIEYNWEIDEQVDYYEYPVAPGINGFRVVKYIVGDDTPTDKSLWEKSPYVCYRTKGSDAKDYVYNPELKEFVVTEVKNRSFNEYDMWQTLLYFRGKREEAAGETTTYYSNPIYKDLEIEWPKLYNMTPGETGWRGGSLPDGDSIDYYCHIINGGDQINKTSVGRYLTKVVNDNNVNCVFFNPNGTTIVVKIGEEVPNITGTEINEVVRVSDEVYSGLFAGGSSNSAFELARQMVCQNTSYLNSISISAIPIYYLEPNNIIKINDVDSGVSGNYITNTISLPLAFNGTMTIAATKAITIS